MLAPKSFKEIAALSIWPCIAESCFEMLSRTVDALSPIVKIAPTSYEVTAIAYFSVRIFTANAPNNGSAGSIDRLIARPRKDRGGMPRDVPIS